MPDVMPYLLCCSNYTRDGDYYNIPCKSSFITPVTESDATLKEAQTLARHSTPQLTMNVYGRLREGRLSNVIEQVAENINTQKKSAIYVQKKTSGENEEAVTPSTPEALEDNTAMEVGGIERPNLGFGQSSRTPTEPIHKCAKPLQSNALQNDPQNVEMHKCALSEQKNSTSLRSKSAIYVQQNSIPEDLAKVVDAWTSLPDGVKSSIMAMIYTAVPDSD